MVKAPCQEVVWELLPAIRAALAAELVKRGMSQLAASRVLDMAPSAVSQYLSKKRGYRIEFEGEVKQTIEQLAEDIVQGKIEDVSSVFCDVCRLIRQGEGPCQKKTMTETQ
jgi:hypothetical protein